MTLSLQARAEVLRLRLASERRERMAKVAATYSAPIGAVDAVGLMDGYLSTADLTAPSDVDGVGAMRRCLASDSNYEMLRRRDGKRAGVKRYADKRRRSDAPTRRGHRWADGMAKVQAMVLAKHGTPEPPSKGCLPCKPRNPWVGGEPVRYERVPEPSRYARIMREGVWRTFDRYTGAIVEFEATSRTMYAPRSQGVRAWTTGVDTVRSRYPVPTGEYI